MKKKIKKITLLILAVIILPVAAAFAVVYVSYCWPDCWLYIEEKSDPGIETSGEAQIQVMRKWKDIDIFEVTERFPLTKKGVFKKYEEIHGNLNNEFGYRDRAEPFYVSFIGAVPDKVTIYYSYMGYNSGRWNVPKAYKETIELSSGNRIKISDRMNPYYLFGNVSLLSVESGYRIVAEYPDGQKKEIAFTK